MQYQISYSGQLRGWTESSTLLNQKQKNININVTFVTMSEYYYMNIILQLWIMIGNSSSLPKLGAGLKGQHCWHQKKNININVTFVPISKYYHEYNPTALDHNWKQFILIQLYKVAYTQVETSSIWPHSLGLILWVNLFILWKPHRASDFTLSVTCSVSSMN